MGQIIWSLPARDDLKQIGDYIAVDSPNYAARFLERIVSTTRRLELFPLIGQVVPEQSNDRVREVHCRPYRIIYHVQPNRCENARYHSRSARFDRF
jgi:toxin ParE1/3/4